MSLNLGVKTLGRSLRPSAVPSDPRPFPATFQGYVDHFFDDLEGEKSNTPSRKIGNVALDAFRSSDLVSREVG